MAGEMSEEEELATHQTAEYSSTTALELDATASNLSSGKAPKEIDESARIMVRNNLRNWNTTGHVIHLSHGHAGGKPSTLLVLRFRFRFDQHSSSRFSKADITLQFSSGAGEHSSKPPVVLKYAPYHIHSNMSISEVYKSQAIKAGLYGPSTPAPVQLGVEGTATSSSRYAKEARTEVHGWSWPSDEAWQNDYEYDDAVSWTLTENKLQEDGIPRELTAAVLLERGEVASFQATVQVRCKTRSGFTLFGWPWSRPNPLVIRTNVSFGKLLQVEDFDNLDEQMWQSLVAIDRPYKRIKVTSDYDEREVD